MIVVLFSCNGPLQLLRPIFDCFLNVLIHSDAQDQPLSIRFVKGEDSMPSVTHTVLLRILAPRWKNLDFIFSKPEAITALDAVRGRLDVAHFFWLSWDYCGHALFSWIRRRIFGWFHVGATLWAAEVIQQSLVWCSGEGDVYT